MSKRCMFCGEPVSDKAWDYVGHSRVWICGSLECEKECRDANLAAQDEARLDAEEDGYGRYMR